MKSYNHRSQHLTASSVGHSGSDEPDEPEKLCCPQVDFNNTGMPNLPVIACHERAKYPDQHQCYGARQVKVDGVWRAENCRGKRYERAAIKPDTHAKMVAANRRRAKKASGRVRAAEIVEMYKNGHPVAAIAKEVRCGPETVRNRLREAGISLRKTSLRKLIYAWLDKQAAATPKTVFDQFDCTQNTARAYYFDWQKKRKAEGKT